MALRMVPATLVALGVFVATGPAPAAVIDPFQASQTLSVDSASQSTGDAVSESTLGGERDTNLSWQDGASDPALSDISLLTGQFNGEGLIYSADFKADGLASWHYDGADGNPAGFDPDGLVSGGSGADLTDGGTSTAFRVDLSFNDQPVDLTFEVRGSSGSERATATLSLPTVASDDPVKRLDLPFSGFSGDPVDFANVGALRMSFDAPAGSDLGIQQLSSIPAPATLPAMLTLVGMLLVRRRAR